MDWCFYSYVVGRRGFGGSGEFGPLSWWIVFLSGEEARVSKMSVIYPLWGGDCGGGEDRAEDRGGKGSPPRRNGRDRGEV